MAVDRYSHLSKEELIRLLHKRDATRKLGLVWERDEIEHERSLNNDFVTVELDEELSIGEPPFDNLLIEGDNFDALRYLSIAYKGRVKCIYIDPPYNTGNKDFIYNDHFIDQNDAYRHSTWLEYLYRRLVLAKDLLSSDGVILVSINDENRAKLELLMDEVFSGMRVGSLVWKKRRSSNAAGIQNFYSLDHEHVLIYAGAGFEFKGSAKDWGKYNNWDEIEQDWWTSTQLTLGFDRHQRKNLFYPLYNPNTDIWYPCDPNRVWARATEERLGNKEVRTETMEELIARNGVHFPNEIKPAFYRSAEEIQTAINDGTAPSHLGEQDDLEFWVNKFIGYGKPRFKTYKKRVKSASQPLSSWIVETGKLEAENTGAITSGLTSEGTKALRNMDLNFPYPKPPSLIRNLIDQTTVPGDIILDFFAGSGTTGQAVLELNNEDVDSEKRSFILVSSTEATEKEKDKNVCRDVTAPRLTAVINGIKDKAGTGGSFAYLRTNRIPFETMVIDIRHDHIWLALQSLHANAIYPFREEQALQLLEGKENNLDIIYVPKLDQKALDALEDRINSSLKPQIIYSWQPGLIRQSFNVGHIQIEKIPDYLTNRFGGGFV
ncbi:site-specific DNA-methyltransferase [Brevibacillus sp. RS1.1]|uniref:site-specific DNA-methyltransferase n=1 Tax=Brevibacillus sp. RS1.1 TaxID=2738982 RepID=UPI00156B4C87|nr:site-specific DNA-methyltransferase [Brevibacillus sp. RS1.1]NRR05512.1 site-specific DNA-methyltransferase [Brevibacillus sp. RS1.1]